MKNFLLGLYAFTGVANIYVFQRIDGPHMYSPEGTAFYYMMGVFAGMWIVHYSDRSEA